MAHNAVLSKGSSTRGKLRVLSGFRPTGRLHLGHLLPVLRVHGGCELFGVNAFFCILLLELHFKRILHLGDNLFFMLVILLENLLNLSAYLTQRTCANGLVICDPGQFCTRDDEGNDVCAPLPQVCATDQDCAPHGFGITCVELTASGTETCIRKASSY